jgi:hypothetical protein
MISSNSHPAICENATCGGFLAATGPCKAYFAELPYREQSITRVSSSASFVDCLSRLLALRFAFLAALFCAAVRGGFGGGRGGFGGGGGGGGGGGEGGAVREPSAAITPYSARSHSLALSASRSMRAARRASRVGGLQQAMRRSFIVAKDAAVVSHLHSLRRSLTIPTDGCMVLGSRTGVRSRDEGCGAMMTWRRAAPREDSGAGSSLGCKSMPSWGSRGESLSGEGGGGGSGPGWLW